MAQATTEIENMERATTEMEGNLEIVPKLYGSNATFAGFATEQIREPLLRTCYTSARAAEAALKALEAGQSDVVLARLEEATRKLSTERRALEEMIRTGEPLVKQTIESGLKMSICNLVD